jgi:hypothetical protein
MRFHVTGRLPAPFGAAILVAAMIGTSGTTSAGNRLHDYVYADSFGNLIVQSPYGSKRIIVGEGYAAEQLSGDTKVSKPEVASTEPEGGYDHYGYYHDTCYRPPVLLKGRSYMYGLPDGVVPEPSGRCPRR